MAVAVDQRETSSISSQPFRWQEDDNTKSRTNVGGTERWLSLIAGGAIAAYALRRRTATNGAAALAATALMYRGATGHCHLYQALGVNRSGHHATQLGTGMIADRASDTRSRLGGRRAHVAASAR